jgi:general secretion pathway protein F
LAIFEYSATDSQGMALRGTIAADSPRQARDLLREQGLGITRVEPLAERQARGFSHRRASRRIQGEMVSFVRELATLLTAGIPLLSALHTLAAQHGRRFRAAIQHLAERIAAGERLADAMGRQTAFFDDLTVSIVQVGESTGSLEAALRRLADFKEKALRLRNRVGAALAYPAFVGVMGVGVSLFLMTYVVPKLLSTLTEAGRPLPGITLAVKAASDFVVNWWWAALGALAVLSVAVRAVLGTERGRLLADRLVLRIPVLGDLVRKEATSRIAIVLAALLRSGLQFVDAVRITRQTLRNRLFRRALEDYERAVAAGSDVAAPLAASGAFSPMVVQMLAVGQEAGQLEEMLEEVAATYDQEVASATARLTALLEPLLIVLLATLVGFIALATVLPILEASNVL